MPDEVKIELTDSEWMALIDGEREGGLQRCCANVSALRDEIISVARAGGVVSFWKSEPLRRALGWVLDGHDLDDLEPLRKFVVQLGGFTKHEPAPLPEE